jgi:hypothetical protein
MGGFEISNHTSEVEVVLELVITLKLCTKSFFWVVHLSHFMFISICTDTYQKYGWFCT